MKKVQPVVLVLDDDVCIRRSLARLFRAWEVESHSLASAGELLAWERLARPACLLLDLDLQGEDGLDLLRQLAETAPDLPVVAMTGHIGEGLRERALEAGASFFLAKPFEAEDLLQTIYHAVADPA